MNKFNEYYTKNCNDIKLSTNVNQSTVVSLTSIPARFNSIKPTINSILAQTIQPEKIIIWIPKYYKRFDIAIKSIPEKLQMHPLVEVRIVDEDFGPATKLLPCLQSNSKIHPESNIIVIDDDVLYHRKHIERLLNFSKQFPNHAITTVGSNVIKNFRLKFLFSLKNREVDILHGYAGYLVKKKFFNHHIFQRPKDVRELFTHDDIWISGNLRRNKVDIVMPRLLLLFKLVKQNKYLSNNSKNTAALCRSENKARISFIKAWQYFKLK